VEAEERARKQEERARKQEDEKWERKQAQEKAAEVEHVREAEKKATARAESKAQEEKAEAVKKAEEKAKEFEERAKAAGQDVTAARKRVAEAQAGKEEAMKLAEAEAVRIHAISHDTIFECPKAPLEFHSLWPSQIPQAAREEAQRKAAEDERKAKSRMVVAEKAREEAEERVHQLEMANKEAMKKVEEEAKAREALASMASERVEQAEKNLEEAEEAAKQAVKKDRAEAAERVAAAEKALREAEERAADEREKRDAKEAEDRLRNEEEARKRKEQQEQAAKELAETESRREEAEKARDEAEGRVAAAQEAAQKIRDETEAKARAEDEDFKNGRDDATSSTHETPPEAEQIHSAQYMCKEYGEQCDEAKKEIQAKKREQAAPGRQEQQQQQPEVPWPHSGSAIVPRRPGARGGKGLGQCENGLNHTLDLAAQRLTGGGASACCPVTCGQCGGAECENRPGGPSLCCIYGLVAANTSCEDENSVGCIVGSASEVATSKANAKAERQQWKLDAAAEMYEADLASYCRAGINVTLDSHSQAVTGGGGLACCPTTCGQCGGGGCEDRPGGADQCCVYGLVAANNTCEDEISVGCIVRAGAKAERYTERTEKLTDEAHDLAEKVEHARADVDAMTSEGSEGGKKRYRPPRRGHKSLFKGEGAAQNSTDSTWEAAQRIREEAEAKEKADEAKAKAAEARKSARENVADAQKERRENKAMEAQAREAAAGRVGETARKSAAEARQERREKEEKEATARERAREEAAAVAEAAAAEKAKVEEKAADEKARLEADEAARKQKAEQQEMQAMLAEKKRLEEAEAAEEAAKAAEAAAKAAEQAAKDHAAEEKAANDAKWKEEAEASRREDAASREAASKQRKAEMQSAEQERQHTAEERKRAAEKAGQQADDELESALKDKKKAITDARSEWERARAADKENAKKTGERDAAIKVEQSSQSEQGRPVIAVRDNISESDTPQKTLRELAAPELSELGGFCRDGLPLGLDERAKLASGGGAFACCPASCGQCGGFQCENQPGGASKCCGFGLVAANVKCADASSVGCVVPAAALKGDSTWPPLLTDLDLKGKEGDDASEAEPMAAEVIPSEPKLDQAEAHRTVSFRREAAPVAEAAPAAEAAPMPRTVADVAALPAAERATELRRMAAEKATELRRIAEAKRQKAKEQLADAQAKKQAATHKLEVAKKAKGEGAAELPPTSKVDAHAVLGAPAPAPGAVVCVALAPTVTDVWCQQSYEAFGGTFHNAQCRCRDPSQPDMAAADASSAVGKKAAQLEASKARDTSVHLTKCRAVAENISDDWCFNNCVEQHASSKRDSYCPPSMCECS
jgi:hypothetical protein